MNTQLMDGKKLQKKIFSELKTKVKNLKDKGINPKLVVVIVGENPASLIYIRHKQKACQELGIISETIKLEKNTSIDKLKSVLDKLNADHLVHGIIVQFPVPKHLRSKNIVNMIAREKDVDGLHPYNQGLNLTLTGEAPKACTPHGIMKLLEEYKIDPTGMNAVVIGRSNIVGRPINYLLTHANASVSTLHTRSKKEHFLNVVKNADLIVSAAGVANTVTPEMIKPGAVIVDVGIIRDRNNKLRGDVEYKKFLGKASYISPVPGGVGPMTIAMLMYNTIFLATKFGK